MVGLGNRRRGGVLLVVLGVLVAMGIVISLMASYALERALLAETRGGKASMGTQVKLASAIEAAMAVLAAFEDVAGGFRSPEEGWRDPVELLEGWPEALSGVEVSVTDESGRPGLTALTESQLKSVLEELGLSRGEAAELGDLLLDWIDEDSDERFGGRENTALSRDTEPWVANRLPKSWDEVWAIPEWGEAVFDGDGNLMDWAALFSASFSLEHEGAANINALDRAAAELLYEAGLIANPLWIEDRDGMDDEVGTGDDRIFSELPASASNAEGLLSVDAQLLRIRAGMKVGERFVWKEAWIAKGERSSQRPRNDDSDDTPRVVSEPRDEGENERNDSRWSGWEIVNVRDGLSLVLEDSP